MDEKLCELNQTVMYDIEVIEGILRGFRATRGNYLEKITFDKTDNLLDLVKRLEKDIKTFNTAWAKR